MAEISAVPAPRTVVRAAARAASYLAGAAALVGAAGALALWPTFTLVVAVVLGVCTLAVFAPVAGFVAAVLLFGVEGTTKVLLSSGGMPISRSPNSVGAAALDLALAAGMIGLLVRDRGRTLRSLWRRLDLLSRGGVVCIAAWLCVSALQILKNPSPSAGVDGFRLTQAYVLAALGGALLVRSRRNIEPIAWALLTGFALVALYGALRAAIGPSELERSLAVARTSSAYVRTSHGLVFRNVGSLSSPFGLASVLVPAAAFSLIFVLLVPRFRALGAIVVAAATAAIIGTQVRAGLMALVVGVVVGALVALRLSDFTRRAKVTAAAAVVAVLLLGAGATVVASSVSPQLRARARGMLNPLGDSNMRARFKLWRQTLHEVEKHPLGSGVGTVGRASGLSNRATVTTDNSYVKILREQGVPGTFFFLAGVLLLCIATFRRLYRAPPFARPLGVAALTAFVSFLVLAVAGEYVEQPGKVLAWTFLGLAVAQAWSREDRAGYRS